MNPDNRPFDVRGVRYLFLILVVAIAGLVFYRSGYAFKPAPDRPGWVMYESRPEGWSVQFPDSWRARRVGPNRSLGLQYRSQVRAVALSNVGWPLKRGSCGENCSSPWINAVGLPPNGIIVQIGWNAAGGFRCTIRHDTPRPITLANAERTLTRDGAGGTPQLQLRSGFVARLRTGNHIMAWIGSKASKADLATLEQIVGSISYRAVSPAPPPSPTDMQNAC